MIFMYVLRTIELYASINAPRVLTKLIRAEVRDASSIDNWLCEFIFGRYIQA